MQLNVPGTFRIHLTFHTRTMGIHTQFQKHVPRIQETIDFFKKKNSLGLILIRSDIKISSNFRTLTVCKFLDESKVYCYYSEVLSDLYLG